ncbi:uncharacterized protein N0V89_008939 [Didymosphaeria variabile]|uniref:Fumarylacetoacetase-like C-terminal domain-containing protein n=1 Tax=Didymosphaeria variabile TaxID=1932322 RepID=A0A9W9C9A8_9PLEO|nr:uncharacterized protein N0V89_008939 [Didymosphaeria variabile]KAJ4350318.1 hypothetical protein N0V89_008939 [Didymosphaeria variabile]
MSQFSRLIRFEGEGSDVGPFFADLGSDPDTAIPRPGMQLSAFRSIEDLVAGKAEPQIVGLGKLAIPSYPPLWTKPAKSIAAPDETIPINDFCAKSLLDYEGEMVFVTSKDCRDVKPSEAGSYILGYTVGNDLSCRMFQLQKNCAGQFFFAKAFDKFAPLGPTLISPEMYAKTLSHKLVVKVNGEVRQDVDLAEDMIFSPEKILSHMSQGTTIPAGTAVMTGTGAGVGAFRKPKTFLQDGDVMEVHMEGVGTLRNKLQFE